MVQKTPKLRGGEVGEATRTSRLRGGTASDVLPRVLVVDDDEQQRRLMVRLLKQFQFEFDCETASGAVEAIAMLREKQFDAVVTDLDMPNVSGLTFLSEITSEQPDVAVVMVTGRGDADVGSQAIEKGAYGYLTKPVTRDDVVVTLINALRRRDLERENRHHREHLEEMVRERTENLWDAIGRLERAQGELHDLQSEVIERLARAAEYRDDETARHIDRMSRYCGILAQAAEVEDPEPGLVRLASVMHDIGKIGIPDEILLKPGRLTDDEFEVMKRHTEFGHGILSESRWTLLQVAASIALTHHERIDGRGYPRGLTGAEIPVEGRIAAIGDVFDALTSDRVYRKAFDLPVATEMMREGRGTQFDAGLLDVFFSSLDDVLAIKAPSEKIPAPGGL
jgi:putative two-component system response regulator